MSRRQRSGHGGKDYHGCGRAQCPLCGNRRRWDGETPQERRADAPEFDNADAVRDAEIERAHREEAEDIRAEQENP